MQYFLPMVYIETDYWDIYTKYKVLHIVVFLSVNKQQCL